MRKLHAYTSSACYMHGTYASYITGIFSNYLSSWSCYAAPLTSVFRSRTAGSDTETFLCRCEKQVHARHLSSLGGRLETLILEYVCTGGTALSSVNQNVLSDGVKPPKAPGAETKATALQYRITGAQRPFSCFCKILDIHKGPTSACNFSNSI